MFLRYDSFAHNTAMEGGGICLKGNALDINGTMSIQDNVAYRKYGGGINAEVVICTYVVT